MFHVLYADTTRERPGAAEPQPTASQSTARRRGGLVNTPATRQRAVHVYTGTTRHCPDSTESAHTVTENRAVRGSGGAGPVVRPERSAPRALVLNASSWEHPPPPRRAVRCMLLSWPCFSDGSDACARLFLCDGAHHPRCRHGAGLVVVEVRVSAVRTSARADALASSAVRLTSRGRTSCAPTVESNDDDGLDAAQFGLRKASALAAHYRECEGGVSFLAMRSQQPS